jgi:AraC-like DNA-binding protein
VLEVSPLLRALVAALDTRADAIDDDSSSMTREDLERERHLGALVLSEVRAANPVPLGVDLPRDKRLRSLCEAVLTEPTRHGTLEGWAAESGASPRTVARLFRQELGTTFLQWRQQVLLARALAMAAHRKPIGHIAAELGYASASAFTAMVTRTLGAPPSRLFGTRA